MQAIDSDPSSGDSVKVGITVAVLSAITETANSAGAVSAVHVVIPIGRTTAVGTAWNGAGMSGRDVYISIR